MNVESRVALPPVRAARPASETVSRDQLELSDFNLNAARVRKLEYISKKRVIAGEQTRAPNILRAFGSWWKADERDPRWERETRIPLFGAHAGPRPSLSVSPLRTASRAAPAVAAETLWRNEPKNDKVTLNAAGEWVLEYRSGRSVAAERASESAKYFVRSPDRGESQRSASARNREFDKIGAQEKRDEFSVQQLLLAVPLSATTTTPVVAHPPGRGGVLQQ